MRAQALFLPVLCVTGLFAQRSAPPDDVRVELRCVKEPARFHMGEVIAIQLSFTAKAPRRRHLHPVSSSRNPDVGQRFLVTPREGTRDPLQTYMASTPRWHGDYELGYQTLGPEPETVDMALNEWVRFDRPGKYSLKAIIPVAAEDGSTAHPGSATLELMSNEIGLEIEPPDPPWEKAELARLLPKLKDEPRQTPRPGQDVDALTALSFLGTDDSLRELARRLQPDATGEERCLPCALGLMGSGGRAAGIEEMQKLLRDPDFPISTLFLDSLAVVPLHAEDPPELLRKQWQENFAQGQAALAAALSIKRGRAQAVSAKTILKRLSQAP